MVGSAIAGQVRELAGIDDIQWGLCDRSDLGRARVREFLWFSLTCFLFPKVCVGNLAISKELSF